MGLDIIVLFDDGEKEILEMSEGLHSKIFCSSTRWSSYKELKKINDYYKTNVTFDTKKANFFLAELIDLNSKFYVYENELIKIIHTLSKKKIQMIRITGD